VLCYAHFGPAETHDHLSKYEQVLSEWVETVAAARAEFDSDEAVVEHLVERAIEDDVWGTEKTAAETSMNVRGVLGALDRC
jgi:hypothetical protein